VTWWRPIDVAQMAKAAGFDGHDAKRAAAVAIAATAGADHYVFDDPTSPAISCRGLWAIADADVAQVGGGDQMNPAESAATTRMLFRANGATWAWHAVYAADAGSLVARTLDALELDGLWLARPAKTFATLDLMRHRSYSSPRIVRALSRYPVDSN